MTRLEKALTIYPDGIVYTMGNKDIKIIECCPYFLDCGIDDLDEKSSVTENHFVIGCRGIYCTECWSKEYIENK